MGKSNLANKKPLQEQRSIFQMVRSGRVELPLSELTKLQKLGLRSNSISDLRPLSKLVELRELYLHDNSISDISALAGMKKLSVLYAGMNSIEDISSLAELVNLTDVSLHNNAITDVSALEEHGNPVNRSRLRCSSLPIPPGLGCKECCPRLLPP